MKKLLACARNHFVVVLHPLLFFLVSLEAEKGVEGAEMFFDGKEERPKSCA
jgi:hypothetical protein